MLVMIMHADFPIRAIDDNINALKFLVKLYLRNFMFHFGSLFKIINLE
jgi:hypothetical protein